MAGIWDDNIAAGIRANIAHESQRRARERLAFDHLVSMLCPRCRLLLTVSPLALTAGGA